MFSERNCSLSVCCGPLVSKPKGVMNSNLVYLRPLRVAYVRSVGPYAQSSEDAWARLFDWLSSNGLHTFPGCGYGLLLDNELKTGAAKCRYEACIETSSVPENCAEGSLQVRKLPGGAYTRVRHRGHYSAVYDRIRDSRDSWSRDSGLVIDDKRPVVHIFLDDPRRGDPSEWRSDVCYPVMGDFATPPPYGRD